MLCTFNRRCQNRADVSKLFTKFKFLIRVTGGEKSSGKLRADRQTDWFRGVNSQSRTDFWDQLYTRTYWANISTYMLFFTILKFRSISNHSKWKGANLNGQQLASLLPQFATFLPNISHWTWRNANIEIYCWFSIFIIVSQARYFDSQGICHW